MTCQEFLARHSEFLDSVMDPLDAARWCDHVASCPSCARYDRVLRRGHGLVQELPRPEPSPDFFPRLQHRIYSLEASMDAERSAGGAGALVSLAVAGVLALLAWGPLLRGSGWLAPAAGTGVAERVAGGRAPAEPVAPRQRPARPLRGGGWSVQLAAEGAASTTERADSSDGVLLRGGMPPMVDSSGPGTWDLGARPMNGWSATAAGVQSVHTAEFHIPGPYSPLVIGAPAHYQASLVRPIDAPPGHD
ncbi:MAG TPA: hypothetical protein VF188_10480 [Longimicrobiales bacterium]